jgi:acyl-CoA dehydrogenase
VRLALKPGAFRDRLTREIYAPDDPADPIGLLEATLIKAIACEEAEKKLERAIRKGEVRRHFNTDWIKDAETKGILSADEARDLASLRDMTARVIAVDDFAAADLKRENETPQSGGTDPSARAHIAAE